jgi:hypothetical protein
MENVNEKFWLDFFWENRKGRVFKPKLVEFGFSESKGGFLAYKLPDHKKYNVVFESLHGFNEDGFARTAEVRTAQIAYMASTMMNAPIMVALKSRSACDLNRGDEAKITQKYNLDATLQREGKADYNDLMEEIIERSAAFSSGKFIDELLVVSIHGLAKRGARYIDIGTGFGRFADQKIGTWVQEEIVRLLPKYNIERVNVRLDEGFTSLAHAKFGRNKYSNQGRVNYLQIEIGRYLRRRNGVAIAMMLAEIFSRFEQKPWLNSVTPSIERGKLEASLAIIEQSLSGDGFGIALDRRQRFLLNTRRGRRVQLWYQTDKYVMLTVHQSTRSKIGMNTVGISKILADRLGLLEGQQVRIERIKTN